MLNIDKKTHRWITLLKQNFTAHGNEFHTRLAVILVLFKLIDIHLTRGAPVARGDYAVIFAVKSVAVIMFGIDKTVPSEAIYGFNFFAVNNLESAAFKGGILQRRYNFCRQAKVGIYPDYVRTFYRSYAGNFAAFELFVSAVGLAGHPCAFKRGVAEEIAEAVQEMAVYAGEIQMFLSSRRIRRWRAR